MTVLHKFMKTKGIGFFKGKVENFNDFKVHKKTFIGWNKVNFKKKFFDDKNNFDLLQNNSFYFVHSYFIGARNQNIENAISYNGNLKFTSIVKKSNVIAFQFHPEKSGISGINLLRSVTKNIF